MTLSKADATTATKIGLRSDLPEPGKVRELFAAGRFLCLANVDGIIYATDNVCPHWGGPLGQGKIVCGKIVCPWHGWEFDPQTGETSRKLNARIAMHKVIIEGDEVLIEFKG